MSEVDWDSLLEEAALWLTRLDSETVTLAEFEAWRNADPNHAAAYARIAATWKVTDRLASLPNFDASMGRPPPSRPSRRLMLGLLTIGGAGVAGAGAYWGLAGSKASAETAIGDRQTRTLPDGGRLDVNTDSKALWKFDDHYRNIWLERGEIALKVVADPRPCRLIGGGRTVEIAIGDINARLRGNVLDILVISGSCEVGSAGTPTKSRLRAGEAALIDAKSARVRAVAAEDASFVSGWRQDELIFNGQTLGAAVDEYNRYLHQKISIADPSLESVRLGGRFSTRDPEVFLSLLHSSFAINVTRDSEGGVILSK